MRVYLSIQELVAAKMTIMQIDFLCIFVWERERQKETLKRVRSS